MYNLERLAVVVTIFQWLHYPEGVNQQVLIQFDLEKLWYIQILNVLSLLQSRCAEIICWKELIFEQLAGMTNLADEALKRADYNIGNEKMAGRPLASLVATTITESYGDHQPDIMAAQMTNFWATQIWPRLVNDWIPNEGQWWSIDAALTNERRVYLLVAFCSGVTCLFHNNSKFGHIWAIQTAKLVSWVFSCPAIVSAIRKYGASWVLFYSLKAQHYKYYGFNMTLSPPSCPWGELIMEFVTDLL